MIKGGFHHPTAGIVTKKGRLPGEPQGLNSRDVGPAGRSSTLLITISLLQKLEIYIFDAPWSSFNVASFAPALKN